VWWLDEEPYPGPGYDIDFVTDSDGFRYPDKSNLQAVTIEPRDWPSQLNPRYCPGDMLVMDGKPVGIIMRVSWAAFASTYDLEVQPYG
jgi:hypothetical protein